MKVHRGLELKKGFVFILGGTALWFQASQLPARSAIIPKLSVAAILISGIALILFAFRATEKTSSSSRDRESVKRLILLGATMVIAYVVIPVFGFYSTLFLLSVAVSLIFLRKPTGKEVFTSVVYCVLVVGVLFVVFRGFLGLPAPRGILF